MKLNMTFYLTITTYYFSDQLRKVFSNVYEILKQNELLNRMYGPVENHKHLYSVQTSRKVFDQSSISKTRKHTVLLHFKPDYEDLAN